MCVHTRTQTVLLSSLAQGLAQRVSSPSTSGPGRNPHLRIHSPQLHS